MGSARHAVSTRPNGRGPNGRPFCKMCHAEVPPRRRSYCSPECEHEWRLRAEPAYLRACVFQRDRGVCAWCGLDAVALESSIWNAAGADPNNIGARSRAKRALWPKGLPDHVWEADHIVPVAEGGGACDLSNLRTLCVPCHKRATADLARRLARKRAAERPPKPEPMRAPRPQMALPLFSEVA